MFMLFVYPAIFHKEEDAYWVEFLAGVKSVFWREALLVIPEKS